MKKLIIATAAISALLASQAMAVPVGGVGTETFGPAGPAPGSAGQEGGGDGVAQWYIYGTAANYCVLDKAAVGNNSGSNVTIDTTSEGSAGTSAYSGNTSDGNVQITQLQGPNDSSNAWLANISMVKSICNTPYTVTVKSANGGLMSSVSGVAPTGFTNSLDYKISVNFAGQSGTTQATTATTTKTIITSPTAGAGNFTLSLQGSAGTQYLLAGTYQDNVLVTLAANVGGAPATSSL